MNKNLIDEAANALQVRAVLLRATSVTANSEVLPPIDNDLKMGAQFRSGADDQFDVVEIEGDSNDRRTVVVFGFQAGVRLVKSKAPTGKSKKKASIAEDAVYLEIAAEFSAHYLLRPNARLETLRPALAEFCYYNVGYHVWPYWREYVQSICARMGMPPIPVGMYRMPKAPELPKGAKQ